MKCAVHDPELNGCSPGLVELGLCSIFFAPSTVCIRHTQNAYKELDGVPISTGIAYAFLRTRCYFIRLLLSSEGSILSKILSIG